MTEINIAEIPTNIPPITFSRGDFFIESKTLYQLVNTENSKFCMIAIKDGNRYRDPITVENSLRITYEEIQSMFGTWEVAKPVLVKNVNIDIIL